MTEAQRLADQLNACEASGLWYRSRGAVAELRRLDAREAELLALLRQARELLIDNRDDVSRCESERYMGLCYDPVIVAINVATGEKT